MEDLGIGVNILLILVVLHFVVGFGYLIFKLSPRKSDKKKSSKDETEESI